MPTPSPSKRESSEQLDSAWDAPAAPTSPGPGAESSASPSRKHTAPSLGAAAAGVMSPPRPTPREPSAHANVPRPVPTLEPDERPAESGAPASGSDPPSELRVKEALAAKVQAESSLSGLQEAVEQALADSRLASTTLAAELERTREIVRAARKERDDAVATLEQVRADHARVLEEHDVFVADLIDEYEARLAGAEKPTFQTTSSAPDTLPETSDDRPTVPWANVANDRSGDAQTRDAELQTLRDEKAALEEQNAALEKDTAKMRHEREKAREMLRRLMAQRDAAQEDVSQLTMERDQAREQVFELKARAVELQERIDRGQAGRSVHSAQTEPAPSSAQTSAQTAPTAPPVIGDLSKTLPSSGDSRATAPVPSHKRRTDPDPLASTVPASRPRRFGERSRPTPPPVELQRAHVAPEDDSSPGSYSVSAEDIEPEEVEGVRISSRPPGPIPRDS